MLTYSCKLQIQTLAVQFSWGNRERGFGLKTQELNSVQKQETLVQRLTTISARCANTLTPNKNQQELKASSKVENWARCFYRIFCYNGSPVVWTQYQETYFISFDLVQPQVGLDTEIKFYVTCYTQSYREISALQLKNVFTVPVSRSDPPLYQHSYWK